ncbi:hypothetical protein K0U27_00630 [archaeon]|nr:hypothetical protein [archaeon]
MTKTSWNDNNYEGKALRRVFTKLLKRYEKEIANDNADLDTLQKIAHTLTLVAKTKGDLAYKENRIEDRIKLLESMIPSDIKKGMIILGAQEIAKELPTRTD